MKTIQIPETGDVVTLTSGDEIVTDAIVVNVRAGRHPSFDYLADGSFHYRAAFVRDIICWQYNVSGRRAVS